MNPRLRLALVMFAAAGTAVWLGIQVAEGDLFFPGLAAAIALAAILSQVMRLPFDLILLGFALFGYLVGNRGFAQLTLPGLPLFPAEAVLMLAVGWRTVACAYERRRPIGGDVLNWLALLWLVIGSVRVVFDLPRYGVNALRDYATVYYVLLFFVVQHMMRNPGASAYLRFCLLAGLLVLPPVYFAYQAAPDFFLDRLTINGVPLVFYKGDLVHGFMVAGALLLFTTGSGRTAWWMRVLAAGLVLYVMPGDSRAAVVAAVVVCGMLAAARRWRFPMWNVSFIIAGAMVVFGLAVVGDNRWAERKLTDATDKLRSIVDVSGAANYRNEESLYKSDNNRFRLVWWRNVAQETLRGNPVFGLGFGHDLAREFVREYSPDQTEEFTARSPHNIYLTVFGRLGIVGLAVWTALTVAVFRRAWRAMKRNDETVYPLWAFCCALIVTGTFGVVLEGPMAAVPFWTVLGLAAGLDESRQKSRPPPSSAIEEGAPSDASAMRTSAT